MSVHSVKDVAKYILSIANAADEDFISNLKLQKLVYYCQGFSLAMNKKKLFSEKIEHWTLGPVCPDLYHEYASFKSSPITLTEPFDDSIFSEDDKKVISTVYTHFGQFTAWKLSQMTHLEDPWKNTAVNEEISTKALKAYFSTQIED